MMLSGPDVGATKTPSQPTALGPETHFALRAAGNCDHRSPYEGMPQISATAIYQPPSQDLPFLAVVLDPEGVIHAVRPFPSEAAAQGFLQAFMQEQAGEYGLAPESLSGEK